MWWRKGSVRWQTVVLEMQIFFSPLPSRVASPFQHCVNISEKPVQCGIMSGINDALNLSASVCQCHNNERTAGNYRRAYVWKCSTLIALNAYREKLFVINFFRIFCHLKGDYGDWRVFHRIENSCYLTKLALKLFDEKDKLRAKSSHNILSITSLFIESHRNDLEVLNKIVDRPFVNSDCKEI